MFTTGSSRRLEKKMQEEENEMLMKFAYSTN